MPAKKQYPRNDVLRVAVNELVRRAIEIEAGELGVTPSDLAYSKLWSGSVGSIVAKHFPDDAPKMEQERNNNGAPQ